MDHVSIYAIISLHILATLVHCVPVFIVEPTRNTVLEAEDVTFYCIIDNLEESNIVLWYRGGLEISRGGDVVPDAGRLSIEMDKERGQYNLMISAVTLADDSNYHCTVIESVSETTVLESEMARLEVHHVPPVQYPNCFPLTKDTFIEGEEVIVTCRSERGNPPVTLLWTRQKEMLPFHTDDTQIGYRNIDYRFTVGPQNHGDILQCKLTTSASDEIHRSCSLGPLTVNYKPISATVKPITEIDTDQEVVLSCEADANPTPEISWSFSPNIDPSRLVHRDNRITFITTASDNGTQINCTATNQIGSVESKPMVVILTPKPKDPPYSTAPSKTWAVNTSRESGDGPKTMPSQSNTITLRPELLAIVASSLCLILVVLIVLVIVTCRCRPLNKKSAIAMPQTVYAQYGPTSVHGWEQGSIYFEPRDRLSIGEMPTWQRPAPWHRNVAVQVPWVEEPPYAEIGQSWDEGMTLEI